MGSALGSAPYIYKTTYSREAQILMRKHILASALIVLGLASGVVATADDIDSSVQSALLDSTLKVLVVDSGNTTRTLSAGSATVIQNELIDHEVLGPVRRVTIITANHVLDETMKPEIDHALLLKKLSPSNTDDSPTWRMVPATEYRFVNYVRDSVGNISSEKSFNVSRSEDVMSYRIVRSREVDIAFVIIDFKARSKILKGITPGLRASFQEIREMKIGTGLLIAGCPMVVDPIVFRNRLVQKDMVELSFTWYPFIGHMVSRVLTGGNSGGGVYTEDGKLVGVVTLRLGDDFGAYSGLEHVLPFIIDDPDLLGLFIS